MKKKYMLSIIIFLISFVIGGLILFLNREYPDSENTLYSIKLGNTKLRFERYDYSLGQNQIVGVEKSTDKGKTYEKLTKEPIIVSMEPKFIFLSEKLGFAISKKNLTKNNEYMGIKVTHDGGRTFMDVKIDYDNPNIDILSVEDVPYYENDILKLLCSVYQIKSDDSGYENVDLTFISLDNGLTWNRELDEHERYNKIKEDIDKEMERYLYFIAPDCNSDNAGGSITHGGLVFNNGFDKEKLLDVNYKSYCKAYIRYKCVEDGKWDWKTTISCSNYTDTDYEDHAEPFSDKK